MIEEIDNMLKESRLAAGISTESEEKADEILEMLKEDVAELRRKEFKMLLNNLFGGTTGSISSFKWTEDNRIS
jgi:hypothetical protein